MSAVNEAGEKVELPTDAGHIDTAIEKAWAGTDQRKWQLLGALQLHE
ncbi:MAG: hypothetical protein JWM11_7582 [Planctomycetaceae bacterium]|nr:hypothetical protein [Planctomycetaceae bacterium]